MENSSSKKVHSSLESEPFDAAPVGNNGAQGPRMPEHSDNRHAGQHDSKPLIDSPDEEL